MGERGYGKVRISIIDDGSVDFGGFFQYSAPFARVPPSWAGLHLHSAVRDVAEEGTTFRVGGHNFTVRLPGQGRRARGVFFSDPCIMGRDMVCALEKRFRVFQRLPALINTLASSNEIDFWGIVGDNFYELRGPIGKYFFEQLSVEAKAKPFLTVPGNHDFWIMGDGFRARPDDQFGNGFMQYYAQDTEAGLGANPFDFSVNSQASHGIPRMHNFLFSHQIGDIAFLGFSGAHPFAEFQPHAHKFCAWLAGTPSINTAVILGHWDAVNLGCMPGMSTPQVYHTLKGLPGCQERTLLFVDGHTHCNRVTLPGVGFMIGANGMGGGCNQFGFMAMDSDPDAPGGPNVRVDYFEVAGDHGGDRYEALSSCLKRRGYTSCRDAFAVKWRDAPTSPYVTPPPLTPSPTPAAPKILGIVPASLKDAAPPSSDVPWPWAVVIVVAVVSLACCAVGCYQYMHTSEEDEDELMALCMDPNRLLEGCVGEFRVQDTATEAARQKLSDVLM